MGKQTFELLVKYGKCLKSFYNPRRALIILKWLRYFNENLTFILEVETSEMKLKILECEKLLNVICM